MGLVAGLRDAALGAALAYWLDPDRGARRRGEARQMAVHATKRASYAAGVTSRDLTHRFQGIVARIRGGAADLLSRARAEQADDAVLAARVRARLGRVCSHPSAVTVTCHEGSVELNGPVLSSEADRVLSAVSKVRGVREIDDDLERHETSGNVPALQGGSGSRIVRPELLQQHWAPATRVLMGAGGAALLTWGAARGSIMGAGAGLGGAGLLLRSLSNLPVSRLLGIGAGRRAIDLQKTLNVSAPVAEVFGFFSRFENFPRIMSHIREVVRLDPEGRRWRWSVTGPAGIPAAWDAELTQFVPNDVIAWRTVAGSTIQNAGIIRFSPRGDATRIEIRLSYNPPGGALGHALVAALGANPRKQLDDDLMQFKSLLETGKATGRSETVTKDELEIKPWETKR
jgi:uncharacterized membrane protein